MWRVVTLFLALAGSRHVDAELSRKEWLVNLRNESNRMQNCTPKSYCTRKAVNLDIEFDARCHCDEECMLFRDCCMDRAVRDDEVISAGVVRGVGVQYWGCGWLGYHLNGMKANKTPEEVSMVTRCPKGHIFSSLCERNVVTFGDYSYLLDVAVLGANSGVWYQNRYCAACHGEDRLVPYGRSVVCDFEHVNTRLLVKHASYEFKNLTWLFPNGSQCELQLTLNNAGAGDVGWIRSCPRNMVEECPAGTTEPSLAEKCRSYALFSHEKNVDIDKSKVYKNPHCAQCHGVVPKCRSYLQVRVVSFGTSLNYVLDLGWDRSEPEVSWNCTLPHGLWDVLHGRCLPLDDVCGQGLTFDGEKCLPVERGRSSATCVKITLARNEYRVIQEGGIVLDQSLHALYENHVFREDQFERLSNDSVAICKSLIDEVHDALVFYSSAAQVYITIVCLSISTACLVLHIATYCLLPKLCNLPGKNLVALSWALLLAQLLLLLGIQPTFDVPHGVCVSIAAAIEYFFLAAFCWMSIMSLDIWRTFSSSLGHANSSRTYRKYSAYAWGLPGLIVATTLMVDMFGLGAITPHLASSRGICWFGSRLGQIVFFTVPVVVILVGNAVLFGITVFKLHQHTRDNYSYIRKKNKEELTATLSRSSTNYSTGSSQPPTQKTTSLKGGVSGSRDETRLYLYLKLFIVMGMTWIFGFLGTLANIPVLMYLFLVLNGLQGALIFFMFDFKRSVGRMLWERIVGRHRAAPAFLDSRGSGTNNNNSSSNQSVAKKKISLTSTSSSLLSSGTFRPISSMVQDHDMAGSRVSYLPRPEEAVELMGNNRTSAQLLLSENGRRPLHATGGGYNPQRWLHKLPQSEVT